MIRWETDVEFLTDAELLEAYCPAKAEAGDPLHVSLAKEIERRGLKI